MPGVQADTGGHSSDSSSGEGRSSTWSENPITEMDEIWELMGKQNSWLRPSNQATWEDGCTFTEEKNPGGARGLGDEFGLAVTRIGGACGTRRESNAEMCGTP